MKRKRWLLLAAPLCVVVLAASVAVAAPSDAEHATTPSSTTSMRSGRSPLPACTTEIPVSPSPMLRPSESPDAMRDAQLRRGRCVPVSRCHGRRGPRRRRGGCSSPKDADPTTRPANAVSASCIRPCESGGNYGDQHGQVPAGLGCLPVHAAAPGASHRRDLAVVGPRRRGSRGCSPADQDAMAAAALRAAGFGALGRRLSLEPGSSGPAIATRSRRPCRAPAAGAWTRPCRACRRPRPVPRDGAGSRGRGAEPACRSGTDAGTVPSRLPTSSSARSATTGPGCSTPTPIPWRWDIDRIRARHPPGGAALLAPGRLPPLGRLAPHRDRDRRRAWRAGCVFEWRRPSSRAGISRRLRHGLRAPRLELREARPDHLGRRGPLPRRAGRRVQAPARPGAARAVRRRPGRGRGRPRRARSTSCSRSSTRRRSPRPRSPRCTRPASSPAKRSS